MSLAFHAQSLGIRLTIQIGSHSDSRVPAHTLTQLVTFIRVSSPRHHCQLCIITEAATAQQLCAYASTLPVCPRLVPGQSQLIQSKTSPDITAALPSRPQHGSYRSEVLSIELVQLVRAILQIHGWMASTWNLTDVHTRLEAVFHQLHPESPEFTSFI